MATMDSYKKQASLCLPAKKVMKTDWNKCLICQLFTKETVSCACFAGILEFQDALCKQNDDITKRLASEDLLEISKTWHRNCHAKYTSSHDLSFMKKRSSEPGNTTETTPEE